MCIRDRAGLVGANFPLDLRRGEECLSRWTDCFMGLLSVLDLVVIDPWCFRKIGRSELVGDETTGCAHRSFRKSGAVGAHVGDVAVFIQTLRCAPGP